jgi:hypothetical protein
MRYVCINQDLFNAVRIILAFVAGCYVAVSLM